MVSPMTTEAAAALSRLKQYRLEHNLTYQQLADEMAASGHPLNPRSLHLALTGRVVPMERTQHRIRKFVLDVLDAPQPSRRARRRQPAA